MKKIKKPLVNFLLYFLGTITLNLIIASLITNVHNQLLINIINLIPSLIILIILILLNKEQLKEEYRSINTNSSAKLKKTIKYYLIGLLLMTITNYIVILFNNSLPTNEIENRKIISKLPFYSIISMIFIVPFIEELIFRFSYKNVIKNKQAFLIITAFIFGLLHVIFNISTPSDILYILPYATLGYYLGKIYYETGSIFYSIAMHSLHNFLCLLMIFIGGIG